MKSQELRPVVEQLHKERMLKREKTSKTIEDLKRYILAQQDTDRLVTGFPKNTNPYKVKGLTCELI